MQTEPTGTDTNTTSAIAHVEDVVRRGIKRDLPCKLEDDELLRIARSRATKEAERGQLEADLAREKKKRQDQIEELDDEIAKMGRELHTGEQDRIVPCNDVFRRAADGTGWIHTIRQDTFVEVERRPATAHETQRYLPSVDAPPGPGASLLEVASHRQAQAARSAQPAADDGVDDVPAETADASDEEADEPSDTEGGGKPKRNGSSSKGKKR